MGYLLLHFFQHFLEDVHLSFGEEGFGFLVVSGNIVILVLHTVWKGGGRGKGWVISRINYVQPSQSHILDVFLDALRQAKEEPISLQHSQGIPSGICPNLALKNILKNSLTSVC